MSLASRNQKERGLGQTNLFGLLKNEQQEPVGITAKEVEPWPQNEMLAQEKEAMGFYFSGHPLKTYSSQLKQIVTSTSRQLIHLPQKQAVTLGGMIASHRVVTTKKGASMAFVSFEDMAGQIEVIVFPDLFKKRAELIQTDKPLVIKGLVERSEEGAKIIGEEIYYLSDFMKEQGICVHLNIPSEILTDAKMDKLKALLTRFAGESRGYLHVINKSESDTVMELKNGFNLADSDALMSHINSLFQKEVVEYHN